ncbi:MAG: hypothetical protein NC548_54545 [Lachnospiraceae bacterium]|nr:hypothetical protein [Lachnospiraceae bacterium]
MKDLEHREINQKGVIALLKKGCSVVEVSEAYPSISRSTLYRWALQYRTTGAISRKPSKAAEAHSIERSRAIELSKEGLSSAEISRQLTSVHYETIRRWILEAGKTRNHTEMGRDRMVSKTKADRATVLTQSTSSSKKAKSYEELLAENIRLKEEMRRKDARLLISETMIEVAEKEFGISIRKKSGAK